jgi:hypothetical protein
MSKNVLQAMMPDVKIYEADMKEGGNPNNLMVQQCSQSLTLSMWLC